METRQYEQLVVWKEAHALCLSIYAFSSDFPAKEQFGLVSQMRRSASSIPMNIVEGNARRSKRERVHFVDISIGSLEELHYQCTLARDLHYLSNDTFLSLNNHIGRVGFLLQKFRASLL